MPLEAVMLCMDNSEYSRNGDYLPTRFSSERDCINLLTSAKLNSNPESTVGLLTLAGPRIELHVSPTREVGRIMNACAKAIEIGGEARFLSGLRTAALALKNRANKNQRQRIIVFCGSPVLEETKELVKVGKAFKKNNIAVDVINFGDEETQTANAAKWEAFIEAVNTSDNSHLVVVPPGNHLSDVTMASPIIVEPGQAPPVASSAGGGGDFGFDADADPEMAMAIRMSMEEERLRQERAAGGTAAATPATPAAATTTPAPAPTQASVGQPTASDLQAMEDDEEALLQQAIALSMQENQEPAPQPASQPAPAQSTESAPAQPSAASANDDFDAAMEDPDFINDLLASVTQTQPDSNAQNQNKPEGDKKPEDKQ